MASSIGISKKKTPEELIEAQGGESFHGKPGDSVRITGGVSGSGLYSPQASGIANQNYNIMDNGRIVVNPGVEEYQWNDKLKRYDAVSGKGRGYLLAEQVNAPAPDQKESGGGGSPEASTQEIKPGYVEQRPGSQGLTTPQMMGDTYDKMMDWRPISSDGSGGVQKMNPLADPGQFIHMANPAHQATKPVGTYINPNIQPQGLLVATPQFKKSQNPYSLLG